MKVRLVVALVGLAISFDLATFAQRKDTVDPEVRQHIEAVLKDRAFNRPPPEKIKADFGVSALNAALFP